MKLTFESLDIQNFKSFVGPAQTLDLAPRPGLHFVRGVNEAEPRLGSNGAGKSSLWTALCWVLWGKTADGLKNPDIRPWSSSKTTRVTLFLDIDGKEHSIERTAAPNALTIDGNAAGPEAVEQLLSLNFSVFTNTILLGQGRPLFFDLAPAEKMQLFTDVLDLERWELRSETASKTVALLGQDKAQAEGELIGLEVSQRRTDTLFTQAEQNADKWENERRAKLATLDKDLTEARATLTRLQGKLGAAELAHDGAQTELKDLRAKQRQAQVDYDALARLNDKALNAQALLKGKLEEAKARRDSMVETGKCPTCGQPLGKDLARHKAEAKAEIDQLVKDIEKAAPDRRLTQGLAEAKRAADQCNKDVVAFEDKAADAWAQLKHYQAPTGEARQRVSNLEQLEAQSKEEINPYRAQIVTLRKERAKLVESVAAVAKEIEELAARLERTKFWVKGFKDIRLYIIEEVTHELELITNAVLDELGLSGWAVRYDVERETKSGTISRGLNVTILSPNNTNPVRWESWSGGEGQRLRLAGALALAEVLLNYAGVEIDTEILDEPTQHLSAEGVRDLCDTLADRAQALGKRIWYVDHMSAPGAAFTSVTTVVKTAKGSRLETG